MCGKVIQSSAPIRYAIVDGMNVRDSGIHNYPPRWNAAPSQDLLVIRRNHQTRAPVARPGRNALGRDELTRGEIEDAIVRALNNRRRFGRELGGRLLAMTIHGGKNREFDGVIVLWPYQVAGNNEQKRRLLYNAITRAWRWCMILVQADAILKAPPFA